MAVSVIRTDWEPHPLRDPTSLHAVFDDVSAFHRLPVVGRGLNLWVQLEVGSLPLVTVERHSR